MPEVESLYPVVKSMFNLRTIKLFSTGAAPFDIPTSSARVFVSLGLTVHSESATPPRMLSGNLDMYSGVSVLMFPLNDIYAYDNSTESGTFCPST